MTLKILTIKRELGIKTTEMASTGDNQLTFNILLLCSDDALITGIYSSSFFNTYVEKKQMDDKNYLAAFTSMLMLFTSSTF